ncbi:MAG: ATP-dependent RecD-like DNA helicase [Lachnospiraceae bacterium]|nr:ATP-dependent RecD-like DNA helicase [Lachnospiraceae bacterium]
MEKETLKGYVTRIKYRNPKNGYTILTLENNDDDTVCVGSLSAVSEGDYLMLTGSYTVHDVYGEQFLVEHYEVQEPENAVAMERYLASGAIKGVGAKLAARIVRRFKEDTFRIMEEEPERLSEVSGISEKSARAIYEQFVEKREMRHAMLFLQQYGISNTLAVKIYEKYKGQMETVLTENPYRLAEDIDGVGFRIADEIAGRVGLRRDSEYRIRAGVFYALLMAGNAGHVYLPEEELLQNACEMLELGREAVKRQIEFLQMEKKVVVKEIEGDRLIYGAVAYYTELNTARMLLDLNVSYDLPDSVLETKLKALERHEEIELDALQREAVFETARNGVFVLTGGPGTGKTTTIRAMLQFFENEGLDILLAAPTGRAAKRITETTGREARTIHRLLELKASEASGNRMNFERNEENPLECDIIIIDEMSMVDIYLLHALLKAVTIGTRLVLVGDVNQLPSVGPGNVLRDIISSGCFKVVTLDKIFRQAQESDIVINAHKIHAGDEIRLDNKSKDFFFLQRENIEVIRQSILYLVKEKLPRYINARPQDIQVLTPMRKGELGVERLNALLQEHLNPPAPSKKEKEHSRGVFREGDKIMQIKNNYQMEWEIRSRYGIPIESGTGVFNGDCGTIREINFFSERLSVEFEEGRLTEYPFSQLDELELAYAATIHKSQGSEYPAVVLPLLSGPRLLMNRNLLYTAVTRAKQCVMIVGSAATVNGMIENTDEMKRYSGLSGRLEEMENKR